MRQARAAELVVLAVALAVGAAAWGVDAPWMLRHTALDAGHVRVAEAGRLLVVVLAATLAVVVRPRVGRWVTRVGPGAALGACGRVAVAVLVALVVSEIGLRVAGVPRTHDFAGGQCDNGLCEPDPRLGWVWKARFERTRSQGWRQVRYAFDADHDRAPSTGDAKDADRPTVLLVGESIVAGHGLQWDETLAARIGDALGVQAVPLGVDGYASDQAFVRLVDAMPRYSHVVAVVTLFFPELVDRVAWIDHPRLAFDGDVPIVTPPQPGLGSDLRLVRLLRDAVPYRDEATIELTGRIFLQTERMAKARGARAIFVTPYLGAATTRGDRALIDELLMKPGLTVVDPSWGYEPIPGDRHPNARSIGRLAEALATALASELAQR